MDRKVVADLVISSLHDVLADKEKQNEMPADSLDESTRLIGRKAVIDSLGLVTLIINIEQILSDERGIEVTIADERAMSQEKSPFRTVGTLADYISLLIEEKSQHVSS